MTTPTLYTVGANGVDITSMVTSLTWDYGRKQLTDRWTPYIMEVELIPTPSFTAPQIGQLLEYNPNFIDDTATARGIITDVKRTYGIPKDATTGATPADRVRITASSIYMYKLSTAKVNGASLGSSSIAYALNALQTAAGTSVPIQLSGGMLTVTTPYNTFTAQTQTYTGNVLDYVNLMTTACCGYVNEGGYGSIGLYMPDSLKLSQYGENADNPVVATYSDADANNAGTVTFRYDQIEFYSSADNTYDKINITYNNQTATAVAGTGTTTYTTNTPLANASDAAQTASVMSKQLASDNPTPFRISMSNAVTGNLVPYVGLSGYSAKVKFRGTTYNCIVEGWTVTQTPGEARYTVYFSPSIGVPLVLDSTAFGILDTNILGLG